MNRGIQLILLDGTLFILSETLPFHAARVSQGRPFLALVKERIPNVLNEVGIKTLHFGFNRVEQQRVCVTYPVLGQSAPGEHGGHTTPGFCGRN